MISVEGVTKRFGDLTAVRDLHFEVNRGEVVGFLGPNGAGKTTTMRMLTGTLEPDEGRVLFDGTPIDHDLSAAKARVGYLPEANPLYEEMLVAEYLEYTAQLRMLDAAETRTAISDSVDETGIGEVFFRPVSELSKGYRQRTGLAAAILHHPEILILDEPTEEEATDEATEEEEPAEEATTEEAAEEPAGDGAENLKMAYILPVSEKPIVWVHTDDVKVMRNNMSTFESRLGDYAWSDYKEK